MRFLFVCLLALWPLGSASAQTDARVDLAEEADLQFNRGVEDYKAGRWADALEHLLASNRLVPNHNVAYNIARCYEQLGRFPEAFRHYADFVARETAPEARTAGEQALERLRPRVALLRVETDPPGALVYLDRVDLGARGATPRLLAVPEGAHRVLVSLEGHEAPEPASVDAKLGTEVAVRLPLTRIIGQVKVDGTPAGAEIRVDGRPEVQGRVPAQLELAPGPRVLEVSAPGRRTERIGLTVEPRGRHAVEAQLVVLTGALVVDADEAGALIEIDGQPAGFTPAVVDAVPVGRHTVRVSLPGFTPFSTEVEVSTDARVAVAALLRPVYEVTAASRSAESIDDAPASVTLVTADEIRAFGHETLYDALGGVRGVFQTDDRTYQALGFRGFSRPGDYGNRVLVLLDGHPMNDDQLGSSYVGHDFQTDLGHVRRIEVVRGPGSALYGSNAFLGVINVVTWDGDTMPRPQVGLAADGRRTARARASGGWTHERLDLGFYAHAAIARAQGDDLRFPEYASRTVALDPSAGAESLTLPSDGTSRGADGFDAATGHVRAFFGDFTLQANYNLREKRIPTGAYGTLLADPRARSDDRRAFVEARWEPSLTESLSLQTRAALDHYAFTGRYPYDAPPVDIGVLRDRWTGTWASGEARLRAAPMDGLTLTGGGELRTELEAQLSSADAVGVNLDEGDARFQVYSAYGVVELEPWSALTISLGGRYDHFSTFGGTLSPRLALIGRPFASGVAKLIAGQAFRAPSPYERLYQDGGATQIAAKELEPETVRTLEFEYAHALLADLRLIGSAFLNQIDGLVDLATVEPESASAGSVLQYQNLDDVTRTVGAELELRRDWRRGQMLSASWAWQRTRVGALSDGAAISNSPEHLVSLRAAVPLGRSGTTLAQRLRLESARRTATGETSAWVPLWDATLTGDVPTVQVQWGLGVRNVFDQRWSHPVGTEFEPLDSVPQPGRSLYASLTWTH